MDTWFGISGNGISDLRNASGFPDAPDESVVVQTMEAPNGVRIIMGFDCGPTWCHQRPTSTPFGLRAMTMVNSISRPMISGVNWV